MKISDTQQRLVRYLEQNRDVEVVVLFARSVGMNREVCAIRKSGMPASVSVDNGVYFGASTVRALEGKGFLRKVNSDPDWHVFKLS